MVGPPGWRREKGVEVLSLDFSLISGMMIFLFPSSKAHCSSLLLPGAGWGSSPAFLGEHLFWEEFKQTSWLLRGTDWWK